MMAQLSTFGSFLFAHTLSSSHTEYLLLLLLLLLFVVVSLNSLVWEYLSILDLEATWNKDTSERCTQSLKTHAGNRVNSLLSQILHLKERDKAAHCLWETENQMMSGEAPSGVPDRICTHSCCLILDIEVRNISLRDK